jgi:hypothetical protein
VLTEGRAAGQLPNQIVKAGFMVESTRKARTWVEMWGEGLGSTKGFSAERIAELKDEVKSHYGRFVDSVQVQPRQPSTPRSASPQQPSRGPVQLWLPWPGVEATKRR